MGLLSLSQKEETQGRHEREEIPCEDTARWPFAAKTEVLGKANLPTHSGLKNHEKVKFCCLN